MGFKVFLHENSISERGTTASVLAYARMLRDGLTADCAIVFPDNAASPPIPQVLAAVSAEFEAIPYANARELRGLARARGVDIFYAQKSGFYDGVWIPSAHNCIHVVFPFWDPHGDRYCFISPWLARHVRGRSSAWHLAQTLRSGRTVITDAHSVDPDAALPARLVDWVGAKARCRAERNFGVVPLPVMEHRNTDDNLRAELGIPEEALVLGSLSAKSSFDIPFVREWLPAWLDRSARHYFLGPNLEPWFSHPRAVFLPTIYGRLEREPYLNTLDALLHARSLGESFGMAICEALAAGKPVFASTTGRDRHHLDLLQPQRLTYSNTRDLDELTRRLAAKDMPSASDLKSIVLPFSESAVLKAFTSQFAVGGGEPRE